MVNSAVEKEGANRAQIIMTSRKRNNVSMTKRKFVNIRPDRSFLNNNPLTNCITYTLNINRKQDWKKRIKMYIIT